MTIKELSRLYHLQEEIKDCAKQLKQLEEQRGISALNMDGMPHAKGGHKSPTEQLAAEIVDLEAIIMAKQLQSIHERNRLERYIKDIANPKMRRIFESRFAQCMSWSKVAEMMGAGYTPGSVRQSCSRYIRENNEQTVTHVTRSM